jgi:hypothetical protein
MILKINTWSAIISSFVFAIIFFFCLFKIIFAFKNGYITFSGVRMVTSPDRRYSRKDQPFMFWAGVVAFSIPVISIVAVVLGFAGSIWWRD